MRRTLSILIVSIAFTALSAARPAWNFDAIGYAAAARSWLGEPRDSVHAHVYADLARVAPKRWAEDLTKGSEYRVKLSSGPVHFGQQVAFYTNKPLYVGLVALGVRLGANSIAAPFYVSALAYGVLAATLLFWMTRLATGAVVWLIAVLVLLSPPIHEVGTLATPDALAASLVFTGVCLIVSANRLHIGLALLVISVLARADGVFLVAAILAWLAAREIQRCRAALIALAVSVLTSLGVTILSGAHSWTVLFIHTFVRRVVSSEDVQEASTLSVPTYLKVLGRGLRGDFVLHPPSVLLFAAWTMLMVLFARGEPRGPQRDLLGLLYAGWIAMLLHVLAFPMFADRFFITQYLLVIVCASASFCRLQAQPGAGQAR